MMQKAFKVLRFALVAVAVIKVVRSVISIVGATSPDGTGGAKEERPPKVKQL